MLSNEQLEPMIFCRDGSFRRHEPSVVFPGSSVICAMKMNRQLSGLCPLKFFGTTLMLENMCYYASRKMQWNSGLITSFEEKLKWINADFSTVDVYSADHNEWLRKLTCGRKALLGMTVYKVVRNSNGIKAGYSNWNGNGEGGNVKMIANGEGDRITSSEKSGTNKLMKIDPAD